MRKATGSACELYQLETCEYVLAAILLVILGEAVAVIVEVKSKELLDAASLMVQGEAQQ
jgi:hypothetical protein